MIQGASRLLRESNGFRLLRGVRVSVTGVALELLEHRVAERAFGSMPLTAFLRTRSGYLACSFRNWFRRCRPEAGVAEIRLWWALLPVTRIFSTLVTMTKSPYPCAA